MPLLCHFNIFVPKSFFIYRYYLGGKACGRLSSCSDPDKIDNDDTGINFIIIIIITIRRGILRILFLLNIL